MDWLGGIGTLVGQAGGIISSKETAKAAAKQTALDAQREFELAKIRAQTEAAAAARVPGAPAEMANGGTGLAPGIPLWALLGVGAGLLLLVLVMRK
jgi:hypothetical protein